VLRTSLINCFKIENMWTTVRLTHTVQHVQMCFKGQILCHQINVFLVESHQMWKLMLHVLITC